MKNRIHKGKSIKGALLVVLLAVMVLSAKQMVAQEPVPLPQPINLKEGLYNGDTTFFKKLFKPLKFRENRKRRIYKSIQELINTGNLSIDSNLKILDSLIVDLKTKIDTLDSKNRQDSLQIAQLSKEALENKSIIDSLKEKSKDSIKIAIEKKEQDRKNDSLRRVKEELIANRRALLRLKSIKYSCECLERLTSDEEAVKMKKEDLFLKPRTKIIGWHGTGDSLNFKGSDTENPTKFKNYNFKFLSAINLFGYALNVDGTSKDPEKWDSFNEVIDIALTNCTDVYLTVYNNSREEVSTFLDNGAAQKRLIDILKKHVDDERLMGVNILFTRIDPKKNKAFVGFIENIHNSFSHSQNQFITAVSIPAITDSESLEEVAAYDFQKLNHFVDDYIVLTNNMIKPGSRWASPKSPLRSKDSPGGPSIQSSIDFYTNGKIPATKLIMSISYMGVEWPVVDFNGQVNRRDKENQISYNVIQDMLLKDRRSDFTVQQGFDSLLATAYLNTSERNFQPEYSQIWYEDARSLKMKYEWALENNLAGVSIMDLGVDDRYTDLWNVLGLTLISISENPLNPVEPPNHVEKCDNSVFEKNENKIAIPNKLFFSGDNFQYYIEPNRNGTSASEENDSKIISDFKWSTKQNLKYKTDLYSSDKSVEPNLLKDKITCKCLLQRWYFYTLIFVILSLILVLILIYLLYKIYRYNTYGEGITTQSTFVRYKWACVILPGVVYTLLLTAWFLYPNLNMIIKENGDGVDTVKLGLIVITGVFLGGLLWYTYFSGQYVKKNLP